MQIKRITIFSLIFLNIIYLKNSYSFSKNNKKSRHSFNSKKSHKTNSRKVKSKNISQKSNIITENKETNLQKTQISTTSNQLPQTLSPRVCDSKYMRCMNKFCSNDKLGKCLCYEDNYTNKDNPSFINLDGIQIKKGFDLLNYSKKQCNEILDKCIDEKRGIQVKYKNFIQRDCLLLSDKIIEKGEGLAAELKELEACLKPSCTIKDMNGKEEFMSPPFSLCFDEVLANFNIDTDCSHIIKKSKSPLSLKSLFFDKMALLREKSCISMDGVFSNDRKYCFIKISYGESKDTITSTKSFKVGTHFTCSVDTFGGKLRESMEAKQERTNGILRTAATGFNIAGAALGYAGTADPIGKYLSLGLDAAETVVDIGLNAKRLADGEMKAKDFAKLTTSQLISTGLSFTGGNKIGKIVAASIQTGMGVVDMGLTANDCSKAITEEEKSQCASEITQSSINLGMSAISLGTSAKNLKSSSSSSSNSSGKAEGLSKSQAMINGGIDIVKGITSTVINDKIRKEQAKEEESGITKHAKVDKVTGKGEVKPNTATNHGNCFINNEFFATENDQYLLLWRN